MWGRWILNENDDQLELIEDGRTLYVVPLSQCETAHDVLGWIVHVCDKQIMSSRDVGDLVHAIADCRSVHRIIERSRTVQRGVDALKSVG